MKKKNKKKTRKKSRRLKKRKRHKVRKKVIRIKITKKTKKSKKRKKAKKRKSVERAKIAKKTKNFRTSNQLAQLKNLTVKKVLSFILQPFVKIYEDFKEKRKIKRLKQISRESRQQERQIKEEARLRKQIKVRELKDEIKIAKIRSQDLKKFIRQEQAILRREQSEKRQHFLEELKLERKIESFRQRELHEIKNLEKLALKEEREDYRPLQERLEKIKEKYRLIREQKIRERLLSLGLEITDTDTKEDLLQKEKKYAAHRQYIELVLESFYRLANSLVFQLNKRYIPKHKSILRVIDRRYETNECFIRYDDSLDEDWLVLIYLEDSNPNTGTIIVENKANPEKHETKSFRTQEIFTYSDYLVDAMTAHIDRERQKKAS